MTIGQAIATIYNHNTTPHKIDQTERVAAQQKADTALKFISNLDAAKKDFVLQTLTEMTEYFYSK